MRVEVVELIVIVSQVRTGLSRRLQVLGVERVDSSVIRSHSSLEPLEGLVVEVQASG